MNTFLQYKQSLSTTLRLLYKYSSTGGWMVRALVFQGDGRVFESNQWLSFDFQILSYLLRFKIRVFTLCASFRTSHSWGYSPVTAVWSPSGQLAGCGLDYGCGRRRTMSIPVRLRAAILGAKRIYSSNVSKPQKHLTSPLPACCREQNDTNRKYCSAAGRVAELDNHYCESSCV